MTISEQQATVLAFIRSTIEARGYPPSLDEIAEDLGVASRTTSWYHCKQLVKEGLLEARPFAGTTAYFPTPQEATA